MRRLLCLAVACPLLGAAAPSIFYSREFPGATPPYVQILLARDGECVYRESVDDPDETPVRFRLRPAETGEIFELAAKVDFFRRPLEANLKVANMGMKTFRYEDGTTRNEQKFNFSQDVDARLLADWFARITESVQHRLGLERATRFDKLGVNRVLLEMQVSLERNRLVGSEQFLPLLEKVAGSEAYLNMARSRAAGLAEAIRAADGKAR